MKNLFGNIASELLEVIMWLDLVVCAVIGYHVGNGMNGHYLIGIILGVLCGGILNVYTYVLFALPIETRDYVKRIAESNQLTEIRNYVKKIAERDRVSTGNETVKSPDATKSLLHKTTNQVTDKPATNVEHWYLNETGTKRYSN